MSQSQCSQRSRSARLIVQLRRIKCMSMNLEITEYLQMDEMKLNKCKLKCANVCYSAITRL